MPGPKENRQKLYQAMRKGGLLDKDITEQGFEASLKDDEVRHSVFKMLKEGNYFSKSAEDFTALYADDIVKKKEVSQPSQQKQGNGLPTSSTPLPTTSTQSSNDKTYAAPANDVMLDINKLAKEQPQFFDSNPESDKRLAEGKVAMSDIKWQEYFNYVKGQDAAPFKYPKEMDEKAAELNKKKAKELEVLDKRLADKTLSAQEHSALKKERMGFYDKAINDLSAKKKEFIGRNFSDMNPATYGIHQIEMKKEVDLLTHDVGKKPKEAEARADVAWQKLQQKQEEAKSFEGDTEYGMLDPNKPISQQQEEFESAQLKKREDKKAKIEQIEESGALAKYDAAQWQDYSKEKASLDEYSYEQIEQTLDEMGLEGGERAEVRTTLLQKAKTEPMLRDAEIKARELANKMGVQTPKQILNAYKEKTAKIQEKYYSAVGDKMTEMENAATLMDDSHKKEVSAYHESATKELEAYKAELMDQVKAGSLNPEAAQKLFDQRKQVFQEGGNNLYKAFVERRTKYQSDITKEIERIGNIKTGLLGEVAALKSELGITEKNGEIGFTEDYMNEYSAIWQTVVSQAEYKDRVKKDLAWEKMGLEQKLTQSLTSGVMNLAETMGLGVKWFAPGLDFPDIAVDFMDDYREGMAKKDYSDYSLREKLTDFDFWVATVPEQLPIMLPMVGASGLGFKAAEGALKGFNLSSKARTAISSLVGGASSRIVESQMEGYGTFQEMLKSGASWQESYDAGKNVMLKNSALTFVDAFQTYMTFGKAPKLLMTSKGYKKPLSMQSVLSGAKDLGLTFASGASEELMQEYFKESEFNPMLNFLDFASSDAGIEIAAVGGVMEAGFSTMGMLRGRNQLASVNNAFTSFFDGMAKDEVSIDDMTNRSMDLLKTLETLKAREVISQEEYNDGVAAVNSTVEDFKAAFDGNLPFQWKDDRLKQYSAFKGEAEKLRAEAENLPKSKVAEKEMLEKRAELLDKEVDNLFKNPEAYTYSIDGVPFTKSEFESVMNNPENLAQLEGHSVKTDDPTFHAKIISEQGVLSERFKAIEDAKEYVKSSAQGMGIDYAIAQHTKAMEEQADVIEQAKATGDTGKYREELQKGRKMDAMMEGMKALKAQEQETVSEAVKGKEAQFSALATMHLNKQGIESPTAKDVATETKKLEKENAELADKIFEAEKALVEEVKAKGAAHKTSPEYLAKKSAIADDKITIRENNDVLQGLNVLSKDEKLLPTTPSPKVAEKQTAAREEAVIEAEQPKAEVPITAKIETTDTLKNQVGIAGFPDVSTVTEKEIQDAIAKNEQALAGAISPQTKKLVQEQTDALKELLPILPRVQEKARKMGIEKIGKEEFARIADEEFVEATEEDNAGLVDAVETTEADTPPKDAVADRERGYRVIEGKKVERPQAIQNKAVGKKSNVTFGKDSTSGKIIKVPSEYTVIELDDLQPSHKNGVKNQKFFIDEAQPRDRSKSPYKEQDAIKGANLDYENLGVTSVAYFGAPVVNERGEAIQGNGRAAALHWYHKNKDSTEYKQWLQEEAKTVGINPEDFKEMKNPVLVRMTKEDDASAIKLGNMGVKNLEDVSREGERESANLRTITPQKRATLASIIIDNSDNEGTVKEVVREAGLKALKYMVDIGMLRSEERAQMISKNGNITQNGVDFLEKTVKALFFEGTSNEDYTAMDDVHGNIRSGLERALVGLLSTKDEKALNKEIANILDVLGDFYNFKKKYPETSFESWMNQLDINGKSPRDRMSEAEQAIATYMTMGGEGGKVPTAKELAAKLKEYVKETSAQEETLFEKASEGLKKEEAVKKVFPKRNNPPRGNAQYSTRTVTQTKADKKDASESIGTAEHHSDSKTAQEFPVKLSPIPRSEIDAYKEKNRGLVPFRRDIISGLRKSLSFFFNGLKFVPRIIYNKSRNNNVLGSISGSNMAIKISNYADIPTIIHELGHWIDMGLGITKSNKGKLDHELSQFWDTDGASTPPGTSQKAIDAMAYKAQNYPNDSLQDAVAKIKTEIETAKDTAATLKQELADLIDKGPLFNQNGEVKAAQQKLTQANKAVTNLQMMKNGMAEMELINNKAVKSLQQKGNSNPTQKQIADEIEELQQDYRRMEGFAQFVRAWMINPQAAMDMAPKTYAAMKGAIEGQKQGDKRWAELEKASYEVRMWNSYNDFERAQATSQETAVQFSRRPFLQKQAMKLEDFMAKWGIGSANGQPNLSFWDRLSIIFSNDKKAMQTTMEKLFKMNGMDPKDVVGTGSDRDFYLLTRLMAGKNDKARQLLERSGLAKIKDDGQGNIGYETILDNGQPMTIGWLLEPLGDSPNFADMSTSEKVSQIDSDKELAAQVMTAQRTLELKARFDQKALEAGEDISEEKAITGLGGDMVPDYVAAQNILDEFEQMPDATKNRINEFIRRYRAMSDATMQYARDSGLISNEVYEQMKAGNMAYVALHRIFEDDMANVSNPKGVGQIFKGVKGSARDRGDAVENMIAVFYATINRADKNYINGKFVEFLRGDESGLEPMPLEKFGRRVDLPNDQTMTFYNNGKAEYWELDADIARAFGVLRDLSTNNNKGFAGVIKGLKVLEAAIGLGPKLTQMTITRFPVFALIVNPIRDFGTRLVVSRTSKMPFVSKLEKHASKLGISNDMLIKMGMQPNDFELTNEEARRLFFTYGGGQAGHDIYLKSDAHYHRALNYAIKDMAMAGNKVPRPSVIWDKYNDFLAEGELMNRIGEFKTAYKHFKQLGLSDYAAAKRAAFEARDLCDFAIQGSIMKYLRHSAPFLNANVQGVKRYMKFLKEMSVDGWQQKDPTLFARFMTFSALPSIVMTVLAHSMDYEKEYNEVPNYQRDMFYMFKLYPGENGFWSIPKPFEVGVLGSFVERMIDMSIYGKKPSEAFDGTFGIMSRGLVPMNPLDYHNFTGTLKPLLEIKSNYDSFRDDYLIEPYDKKEVYKERTGTKYASNLGQWLGGEWTTDPRNVDHLIGAWFGYFGNHAIKISNMFNRMTSEEKQALEKELEGLDSNSKRYNEISDILKSEAPANPSQMYNMSLEGIFQEFKLYRYTNAKSLKVVKSVLTDIKDYQLGSYPDADQLETMLNDAKAMESDSKEHTRTINAVIDYAKELEKKFEKAKELYDQWLDGKLKEYDGINLEGFSQSQAKSILFQ